MNYQEIDGEELQEILNNKEQQEYVLLDVRTPEEIEAERIPGSISINFYDADFRERIQALDKDKTYYVYCRSGNRSGKACAMMMDAGFKECHNLIGGMMAWSGDAE